jgi:hypothetical protein
MWNRQGDDTSSSGPISKPAGVIDTLGLGFETVLSRPLLIVPPVFLDLYLWLGVHVTSEPLMMRVGDWLRRQGFASDATVTTVEQGGTRNIAELAVLWMPTLRVPSFLASVPDDTAYRLEAWRPVWSLSSWTIALLGAALLVVGLIVGAEYLLAIAAAIALPERDRERFPGTGTLRGAWNLVSWYIVAGLLATLILWPVFAAYVAAEFFGNGSSFWLVLMLLLPVSWAFVLFFFSVQAMFVDRVGPLQALRSSYRVVRSDGWNSLGIIFVYFLLTVGFPQVWLVIASQPIGLMIAIAGHAFIGTGIIAATMVFYRDRVQQLDVAGRM